MMGTDGNVAASVNQDGARNNLETINGIGPTWADALYTIGIHCFEDLAQYTPQDLSKTLHEQVGAKVPPERIETKDWIGQAKALAETAHIGCTPSDARAREATESGEASDSPRWRQHAGFSVFFDFMTDEHGTQTWQTRVYHNESGEEASLPGTDAVLWVNWILERANLPITAESVPIEDEAAAPPTLVSLYDTGIQILDVQLYEIGPSSDISKKRLLAEVRFQVSGSEAEALTANGIPFWIKVHTVDLQSGASNLVASDRSELQPQVFRYARKQEFQIPDQGRYKLHTTVLLLSPADMMACHRGPIINVVP